MYRPLACMGVCVVSVFFLNMKVKRFYDYYYSLHTFDSVYRHTLHRLEAKIPRAYKFNNFSLKSENINYNKN